MKTITTSITQRGQVTIPAEVRRKLGLEPRGKVVFEIDGDTVRLRPAKFTLQSAFGSVKPLSRPEDFSKMIREAKEERADRTARKVRDES